MNQICWSFSYCVFLSFNGFSQGFSGIIQNNVLIQTNDNRSNLIKDGELHSSSSGYHNDSESITNQSWTRVTLTEPHANSTKPSIKESFLTYLNSVDNISAKDVNMNSTRFASEITTIPTSAPQFETMLQQPYTTNDSSRNKNLSKQLQLQFVLDCKLVDPKTKQEIETATMPDMTQAKKEIETTTTPTTTTKKKKKKPKPTTPKFKIRTTTPRPRTQPTATPRIIFTTSTEKLKVKKVYVDPPAIKEIGNAFENIYNYFEDTLVDKEVRETKPVRKKKFSAVSNVAYPTYSPPIVISTQPTKKHQVQSLLPNRFYLLTRPGNELSPQRTKRTTFAPQQYLQQWQMAPHNNTSYLTTKIHVTSEYSGPHPTSPSNPITSAIAPTSIISVPPKKKLKRHRDESEEEDYYYDGFNLNGLSFNPNGDTSSSGSEEDEDSTEDSNEGGNEGSNEDDYPIPTDKSKKKKNHRKNSFDSEDENGSYESHEETDYASSMDRVGQYFGNFFTSVGKFAPKFPSFRGYTKQKTEQISSTTPKIESRRPKNPIYIDAYDYRLEDEENRIDRKDSGSSSWFSSMFAGSDEEPTSTLAPVTTTEDSSNFFNWFESQASDQTINDSPDLSIKRNSSTWFFGLFGDGDNDGEDPSTTTSRPFLAVSNPFHKPQNWLGILAQHLSTTTTKSPYVELDEVAPKHVSYRNHQLLRLLPATEEQLRFLQEYRWSAEGEKLQWWKGPTLRGPTDILVPSKIIADVKESLIDEDIPYDVVIWDLEKAIMYENPRMSQREKSDIERAQGHPLTWHRYHEYDDIVKYLQYLQRMHSDVVELIHIGRSFESRPLIIVKIAGDEKDLNNSNSTYAHRKKKPKRPAIFLEAGCHGREWIGPAVATWIIKNLIKNVAKNDSVGETIRSVDWYIMPVLNPDGYEFSHEYDRLWRKNRSKHPEENRSIFMKALQWFKTEPDDKKNAECFGTDLNRNWNYMWNGKGSSNSKCSDYYAGPKAFSEPETKALAKFFEEYRKYLKIFLSLHSYGQILSYPTMANASYNYIKSDDLFDMAQVALETIRDMSGSTRYSIDSTNEMMHSRSGTVDSYALYELDIKYSYTLELRDTGTHGFLLPPSYIEPTAKETFEIMKGMVDYI